jgi:hypothetical protein
MKFALLPGSISIVTVTEAADTPNQTTNVDKTRVYASGVEWSETVAKPIRGCVW